MSSQPFILGELRRERDRLVERAYDELESGIKRLTEARQSLESGLAGGPWRPLGNNTLFPLREVDVSIIRAAFDAVDRVAVWEA